MRRSDMLSESRFAEMVRGAVCMADGAALLAENDRLWNDPDRRPTPEACEAARVAVRSAYRRRDRERRRVRALKTALAAIAAAAMLMTGAFAAFPGVRQLAKDLFMRDEGDHVTLWYEGTETPRPSGSGPLLGYDLPDAPEGFALVDICVSDLNAEVRYGNADGGIICLAIMGGDDGIGTIDVNTELAIEERDVAIMGHAGLLVIEEGFVHLTITDDDHSMFISIFGIDASEDALFEIARQLFASSS